jgi:hypothetical protein
MKQQTQTRWIPPRSDFTSDATYNAHRIMYQQFYALQDKVEGMAKVGNSTRKPEPEAGGPSNTKIAGLNVSGSPSAATPHLVFNPATGELEWST